MKTNKEKYLKYYYSGVISSFIFILASFGILAFPKQEKKAFVVYPKENIMVSQKINTLNINKSNNTYTKKVIKTNNNQTNNEIKVLTKVEEEIPYVELEYGKNKNSEEVAYVKENFGDKIKKYADMYGLDEDLILAIATLNKDHSEEINDQGNIGIMGIQFDSWYGQTLKAYNFDDNQEEVFTFDDKIKELEGNIQAGCVIFQNELKKYNYNILVGIQSYQYGGYYMKQVLSYYAQDSNKTYEQVLNSNDINWMKYRLNFIQNGDSEYIEHVLSYYTGNGIIEIKKNNEESIKININKKIDILNKIKGV